MFRLVNQCLAVVVSLTIGVFLLEGGLRLVGLAPAARMHQFDPIVGWVKVPGADIRRQTDEFDVRVRTNSRGLRGPEAWSYARREEVARILMIGDSFTLGYTVAEEQSIPSILGRELAANGLGNALLRRPGPGIDLGGQRGSGGITVWFD